MLEKYRATIHGDRIEWEGDGPTELGADGQITVDVTVIGDDKKSEGPDNERAVAALRKIAERGGIKSIPDPAKWQRQIRRDRPLPGR